ncbi:MAG: carbohydrate ABC transporter permease, partial [Actinomycetia bacterium]|nr:carbohydrate ABC transporter permease [Actinomycetes bacterium]
MWGTAAFHTGAGLLSLLWLVPIAVVLVTAARSFDDIAANGLGSLPHSFTLGGFRQAWVDGGQQQALINSLIVSVPTVLLSLLLASMAAFALSRYDVPLRRALLLLMLSGNLLPPQILLIPVSKLSEQLGLYDSLYALIGVQIGFGVGFYVFVLHGFMRAIPPEIQQAAVIDGAGPWQIYTRIILPLARPALAA